ncbi:hypothetical protein IAR50_006934 [Cryptococcus sp. DSM 104548]
MAAYKDTYTPPPPPPAADGTAGNFVDFDTPPDEYDFNYVFPVNLLMSDRVELRPMVPSLHAELHLKGISKYPELFKWIPAFPAQTLEEALVFIEEHWRQPSGNLSYAIFTEPPGSTIKVEPKDYVYAGSIAITNSSYEQMSAEIGYVAVLSPFHRTHVHTHATGLLLHYILDHPSQGGLGLRRCQWLANSLNEPSQKAALRMGFVFEGVQRCKRVLPRGKVGARQGRRDVRMEECDARDDWVSGITWYEWEERGKEAVDALMARRE